MTIKKVNEYLRIAKKTAYRLVADSRTPGCKVSGIWYLRQSRTDVWTDLQLGKDKGVVQ